MYADLDKDVKAGEARLPPKRNLSDSDDYEEIELPPGFVPLAIKKRPDKLKHNQNNLNNLVH